jgi:hypothetical protein
LSETLDAALWTLRAVTNSDDMRWLTQYVRQRQGLRPRLRGILGGFEGYTLSDELEQAHDKAEELGEADLRTFGIVVDLLYELLRPKSGDESGQVDLKTIVRSYPQIDFNTGLPEMDANGDPVFMDFAYTYCYIRQYASKGGPGNRTPRLLSIYADRGMGKGGSGGYVAAALRDELVTREQILSAWHSGEKAYENFIDECKALLFPAHSDEAEDES